MYGALNVAIRQNAQWISKFLIVTDNAWQPGIYGLTPKAEPADKGGYCKR